MMRPERRSLLATAAIASLLALVTAYGVHRLRTLPRGARDAELLLAAALQEAARAELAARGGGGDLPLVERQASREAARGALAKALRKHDLESEAILDLLGQLPSSEAVRAVNQTIGAAGLASELHAHRPDPERVAVYRQVAALSPGAPAPPVRVVESLGRPSAKSDAWLASDGVHAVIPLRALARDLVATRLLPLAGRPELCPGRLRLASHVAFGSALDVVRREATRAVLGDEAASRAPGVLLPLCRRERLIRLTDAAIRKKGHPQGFPFLPSLLFSEPELELVERLARSGAGLGAEALGHLDGLERAEGDTRGEREPLGALLQQLLPQSLADSVVLVRARQALESPRPMEAMAPGLAQLVSQDPGVRTEAEREFCALNAELAATKDRRLLYADLLDRFTVEKWPASGERSAILAVLYAAAAEPLPKEGVAALAQLERLWEKLRAGPPPAPATCAASSPPLVGMDPAVTAIVDRWLQ